MVRRLVSTVVGLVGVASFAYVAATVPIGRRTLWEHFRRIAATEPAQDLGRDISDTSKDLGERVRGAAGLSYDDDDAGQHTAR